MLHQTYLAPDERGLLSRYWESASGFWRGPSAWRAWLLIASVWGRMTMQRKWREWPANRASRAQRFEGATDDLFEFQDQITASILGSLEPQVHAAEAARIRDRPTESLYAYDCVLKAMSRLYLLTAASYHEAGELLERAIALDATALGPCLSRLVAHFPHKRGLVSGPGGGPAACCRRLTACDRARPGGRLYPGCRRARRRIPQAAARQRC